MDNYVEIKGKLYTYKRLKEENKSFKLLAKKLQNIGFDAREHLEVHRLVWIKGDEVNLEKTAKFDLCVLIDNIPFLVISKNNKKRNLICNNILMYKNHEQCIEDVREFMKRYKY